MAISSHPPTEQAAFLPEHPSSASILVAEDPFVSSFLRTVLQRHGFEVVIGEALRASELLSQGEVAADLLITNQPEPIPTRDPPVVSMPARHIPHLSH